MSAKRRVLRKLRRSVAKQLQAGGEIKFPIKDLKYVAGFWFWCGTVVPENCISMVKS